MRKTTLALVALASMATVASAQSSCGPTEGVQERLHSEYGESVQSMSLSEDSRGNVFLVEMLANTESGTWTFLLTGPNGVSCVLSSGTNYQHVGGTSNNDPQL